MPPPIQRNQTGIRPPTRGQFNKPGYFYPTASDPVNDYGLVEIKTVDSKEQPTSYLSAHPADSALKLTKQTYEQAEDGKKTRTRIYRTLPGALTTKYLYDEELDVYIAADTQDVPIGTPPPTASLIINSTDAESEQGWITRSTLRFTTLPPRKTELRTEMFTFPALLEPYVDTSTLYVGEDLDTTIKIINPIIRPALNCPAQHRIVTEFFESRPFTATANASTDRFTIAGVTPTLKTCLVFTSLTGAGPEITLDTPYYVQDISGATCKLSAVNQQAGLGLTATALASNDRFTFSGVIPQDGLCILFTSVTGAGPEITTDTTYYMRDVSGKTCKLATSPGAAAINITANITAATGYTVAANSPINITANISAATGYTIPERDTIYEILPNNPRYSGRLIDFNFGEVLNNAFTIAATAGVNDSQLLGLSETVNIGSSIPSYDEYFANIGQEKLISSDVQRFRGNVWTKINTYIRLR